MTGVPVGATADNLKSAIEGETYEYTEMYPGFAKAARDEGFDEVADWLETLARAEKSHAGRFTQGLESLSPEPVPATGRLRLDRRRPTGPTPGPWPRSGPSAAGDVRQESRHDGRAPQAHHRRHRRPARLRARPCRLPAPGHRAEAPPPGGARPMSELIFENPRRSGTRSRRWPGPSRCVADEQIQAELDVYNPLIPEPAASCRRPSSSSSPSEDALRDWLPKLVGMEPPSLELAGLGATAPRPSPPSPRPPTRSPHPGGDHGLGPLRTLRLHPGSGRPVRDRARRSGLCAPRVRAPPRTVSS